MCLRDSGALTQTCVAPVPALAEEKHPLTHKYVKYDRTLREAGVSVPKENITYRSMAESQNLGRRFQEAYLDPQDRTVLGVRRYG